MTKGKFTMAMLTELKTIVENAHSDRKSEYRKLLFGRKKIDWEKLKAGIKEDEANPFTPIGKTAAILNKIQEQMDNYNEAAT